MSKQVTLRDAYIYYYRCYLEFSSYDKSKVLGLWVSDPLDVTQVVYNDGFSPFPRGIARCQPVEEDWENVIPAPPRIDKELFTSGGAFHEVFAGLDEVNREIHMMAMLDFIELDEPHDVKTFSHGIGWIGDPTDYLLPDDYKVPLC